MTKEAYMERKIKMKATSRSIKILNRSVRGHSKRISACLVGRPKDSYAGTGEADPRRAAEGEALAAGKRAAALAGRSARGTVRRLGRKGAKAVAEAREERSRARTTGRRGPRTPTETGRGAGTSAARGDGRQEAPSPSGAPRLAQGRGNRGGVPVSQNGREAAKGAASTAERARALAAGRARRSSSRRAARAARRASVRYARMAAASARAAVAALSSLGALALGLVVIVALAGLIASSPFGIFFSGGDMGDGNPTLREAISGLNEEHQARIDRIAAENPHDELSLAGSRVPWREVLAVWSVRTAADPDDPADVLTLDERRLASLEEVFWDMNAIDFEVQERRIEEIVEVEQEDGTVAEGTETVTRRVLVVTLSARSPDEAAASYGFTAEQGDMLAQLLDDRYAAMWQSVLYGVTGGSGDIVEVAAPQIGNVGGQPYWSWYGFSGRVEWCACFVSWCANECGYIEAGAVPKFAACSAGVQWFESAGLWRDRGYEPRPGDIVFFDWGGDGGADHVGIVESCDGSTVHTIEGNTSDSCARRSYRVGSASILGYGTPLY